jgi:hypothetical protein
MCGKVQNDRDECLSLASKAQSAKEEQDRWLLENREAISAKIRRGLEQLDRGEGISEGQLSAYLAELRANNE